MWCACEGLKKEKKSEYNIICYFILFDAQMIDVFHSNLQYLMDTMYSSTLALYHHGNPVIFWFGGGLTSGQFRGTVHVNKIK